MKAVTALVSLLVLSTPVMADELMIFPANDQTAEQQKQDEAECFIWAKDKTGFDPTNAVVEVDAPKKKRGGAVRGAVLGAAIGDDSDAAKKGAAVGAVRQGRRNKKAAKAAKEEQAKQEAAIAEQRAQFQKATAACLEGKGYTVK